LLVLPNFLYFAIVFPFCALAPGQCRSDLPARVKFSATPFGLIDRDDYLMLFVETTLSRLAL
ncbi:MAG: hypothetical protein IKQ98_02945, partial [Erysipelotrichaceae bacterium]|nr:hypothetical protein [Erysipelotrichaceae bacterium]